MVLTLRNNEKLRGCRNSHLLCSIDMAMRCKVCGSDVQRPRSRRRLDSASASALTNFMKQIGILSNCSDDLVYACKPCYSKLEKGSKAAASLQSLAREVRSSAGLSDEVSLVFKCSDGFAHASTQSRIDDNDNGGGDADDECDDAMNVEGIFTVTLMHILLSGLVN